jgi:hypothetical protein
MSRLFTEDISLLQQQNKSYPKDQLLNLKQLLRACKSGEVDDLKEAHLFMTTSKEYVIELQDFAPYTSYWASRYMRPDIIRYLQLNDGLDPFAAIEGCCDILDEEEAEQMFDIVLASSEEEINDVANEQALQATVIYAAKQGQLYLLKQLLRLRFKMGKECGWNTEDDKQELLDDCFSIVLKNKHQHCYVYLLKKGAQFDRYITEDDMKYLHAFGYRKDDYPSFYHKQYQSMLNKRSYVGAFLSNRLIPDLAKVVDEY